MQITIRKGVPLPSHGLRKYPWRDMEVGDSFLFPAGATQENAATQAVAAAKRLGNGHHFVTRQIKTGKDAGRIGVWRVE